MSGAAAGVDRYAVVGHPVSHSLSPRIHAEFARRTGERVEYGRVDCPPGGDGFAATLRRFAAGGARGCNVTLPFKFEAFALAARPTARARRAGACNTLRFDGDGPWHGDNTDGAGLVRDVESGAGFAIAGARVLVVGAGGAAAGILGPLLETGPRELVVANRDAERAARLVERWRAAVAASAAAAGGGVAHAVPLGARPLDDCGAAFDLVVNATASSVAGVESPVDARVLRPGGLAVDLMYGEASLPFQRWATRHGAVARDGLGMLVEQAAEAFWFWRGVRPSTAGLVEALRGGAAP